MKEIDQNIDANTLSLRQINIILKECLSDEEIKKYKIDLTPHKQNTNNILSYNDFVFFGDEPTETSNTKDVQYEIII